MSRMLFRSKKPSDAGDGNRCPPSGISREEAKSFADAAYEKAAKEGRELFFASLEIDSKIKEATKQIEKPLLWYVGILSFAVALGVPLLLWHTAELVEKTVSGKFAEDEVQKRLERYTDEKVEPMLALSIREAEARMKIEADKQMQDQLHDVNQRVLDTVQQVEEASRVISVYEQCVAARSGYRDAYDKLRELAKGEGREAHVATLGLEEIVRAYEQRKSMPVLVRRSLYDTRTGSRDIPEDVIIQIAFADNIGSCDGAINMLAELKDPRYVAALMHVVIHSGHLDFVYDAIRGIEPLTGEAFPALGITEAMSWWEANKENDEYRCEFERFLELEHAPDEDEVTFKWRQATLLAEWISKMPNQVLSAKILAGILVAIPGDNETSPKKKELFELALDKWSSATPLDVLWYVYKTVYFALYDQEALTGFVNDRSAEHPEFKEELQPFFPSGFFEFPLFHWPQTPPSPSEWAETGEADDRLDGGDSSKASAPTPARQP